MPRVPADDWRTIDVASLEPEADRTVRSMEHTVVVAGPGAGKTELLAQRACYLLQTRLCPIPRRILAISFKRDAAKNLRDRVDRRCGRDVGQYFDSFTFDAFAKGLVDRFRLSIPEQFRPTADYTIENLTRREIGVFLDSLTPPARVGTKADVAAISREQFLKNVFHRFPLLEEHHTDGVAAWTASEVWRQFVQRPTSRLTFPMIGRLAELLLRTNRFLASALRHTYAFVFLDEFQDTTRVQFELTRTAFSGSDALVTAVGDNKQRIMGWAEALDDAFGEFATVFPGSRRRLKMNYRSAPRLVQIQEHLVAAIDAASVSPEAADDGTTGEGDCRLLVFRNAAAEARVVAQLVADLLRDGPISPRDVCILVKQRAELYASEVIRALRDHGILARIESEVQDLLAEPFVEVILPFLRLVAGDRRAWADATEFLVRLRHGCYHEDVMPHIESELSQFVQRARAMAVAPSSLPDLASSLLNFLGTDAITGRFPQYAQGSYFADQSAKLHHYLTKAVEGATDLLQAITRFEGADSVPIMTIHKSKGLEYHTVIFLGLEDDAFWSFRTQSAEDTCAFFVAFSRAKKQVLFTFSESRVSKENQRPTRQSKQTIGVLYDLLVRTGVLPENLT